MTYRGVTINKKVAPLVAYADAKRYWGKNVHLTPQELAKAAIELGKGVYNFFIGDDVKTLQDPNATLLEKVWAGGSLALTFGGGFIEKATLKVGGALLTKVVGKSEKTLQVLRKAGLTEKQIERYIEFAGKRGKIGEIEVRSLPNQGKVFQTRKPADHIPDSYAVWQQQVDAQGRTIIFEKTTILPDGSILHSKQYFPKYVPIQPPKGTY